MELSKLRESWEKGANALFFVDRSKEHSNALSILTSKPNFYTCYRYICFWHGSQAEKWDVSVDHRDVSIEVALAWLQEKLS